MHDGEDHELLFTMQLADLGMVTMKGLKVYPIGVVSATPGVWLRRRDGTREPLEAKGWEHSL